MDSHMIEDWEIYIRFQVRNEHVSDLQRSYSFAFTNSRSFCDVPPTHSIVHASSTLLCNIKVFRCHIIHYGILILLQHHCLVLFLLFRNIRLPYYCPLFGRLPIRRNRGAAGAGPQVGWLILVEGVDNLSEADMDLVQGIAARGIREQIIVHSAAHFGVGLPESILGGTWRDV